MDLRFWNRPRICTRRMILEALEERIVMDAAVDHIPQDNAFLGRHGTWSIASALDPWADDTSKQADMAEKIMPVHSALGDAATEPFVQDGIPGAVPASTVPAAQQDPLSQVFSNRGLDIVLVSTDAAHFDAISQAVSKEAKALLFDPQTESLQSISAQLHDLTEAAGKKIEHLAIVAPGSADHLQIGVDLITSKNVHDHQSDFKALAESLTPDARIDLYGCDIAQGPSGTDLVNKVAGVTGVTVWASSDVTGTVPGANWDLEVQSASDTKPYMIDANALASYQIHLADPVPGPDPDHHVNKTATGMYRNLTLTATDIDQPPAANVIFTTLDPTEGTVTLEGTAVEVGEGAYQQSFTFQATTPNEMVTGPVAITYFVQSQGFPSLGTEIDISPIVTAGEAITCAAFGNVDTDGIPDIVIGTTGGAYSIINNTDGTFGTATLVPGTGAYYVRAIALGPVQPNNNVDDLVIGTNARNRWVENNDGVWGTVRGVGTAAIDVYDTTGLVVADLGNPSGMDVVEVNSDGLGGVIYSNNGTGPNYLSGGGVQITAGVQPSMHALAVANVDGVDGNDVILGVDGEQIRWHHGNGDGTVDATINTVGDAADAYNTISLLVTDTNADGNPDIVQGNADGTDAYLYINGGSGSFATAGVNIPNVGWPEGIDFADMNGDGNPDLLFGNPFGANMFFLGDGAGNFASPGISLNTDNGCTVAISAREDWWPDNNGLEVVVINDTLANAAFEDTFSGRMYSWGNQPLDGAVGVYTLEIDAYNRPPVDRIDGSRDFLTHPQVVDPITGTLVFSAANGNALTVTDPDAFTDPIVVTLTAENGNDLFLGPTVPDTLTVEGNGTEAIVLTGSQADIDTALEGLLYRSHRDRYMDSEGLILVADDQGHNESGTESPGVVGTPRTDTERVSIAVNVLYPSEGGEAWWNEAPQNRLGGIDIGPTNPAVSPQTDVTGQVTFTGGTQLTVWDPDADAATDPIEVRLMPVGGDVRLANANPLGVILNPLGDHTNGGLTLVGSQNDINNALESMTFRILPAANGSGPASLTISSIDQGYNDHDQDGNLVQNPEYAETDTDTIYIDTTANPVVFPWWNQAPVHTYGAFPIAPNNPVGGLVVDSITGTLVFDGGSGTGHANFLGVADDAEMKAPFPWLPRDAQVQTSLAVNNGILTVAYGWPDTVTVTNNGTNRVTLVGPPTDLSMALEELEYVTPDPSFVGNDTLVVQTDDLGHNPPDYVGPLTDTDTIAIVVGAPTDGHGNVFYGRSPRR